MHIAVPLAFFPPASQECMLERADEPVAAALLAMAAQQQVGWAGCGVGQRLW